MIQVDVFWSFAFGASFAAAAARALQKEENFYSNRFFAYCAFYLGCIFGPSGIYLLWAFPGWESMFMLGGKESIPAILPTIFASTNVLLGLLGFWLAYHFIRRGRMTAAHMAWIVPYTAFAAILGLGYSRFLYAGTHADWAAHRQFHLLDWFTSDVFHALLGMAPIVLPAYMVPVAYWYAENYNIWELVTLRRFVVVRATLAWLAVAAAYLVVCVGAGASYRASLAHGPLGFAAPLAAFAVAQLVVFALLLLPLQIVISTHAAPGSVIIAHPTSPARKVVAVVVTATGTSRSRSRSPARVFRG